MANPTEIANEIEALAVHCRPSLMSVEARSLWVRDWCEDLGPFPIEAIRVACRKFRQSGAVKFPTPGQLMPMVRAEIEAPAPNAEPVQVWGPISDLAYDALGLPEKIRHQRLLAHQARRKAGPMWLNGRPAGPDELPERWHEWTKRAENHEAEATRLSGYLRRPTSQAAE
jgi:hypothetical protein